MSNKVLTISVTSGFALLLAPIAFIFSTYLLGLYVNEDQVHYRRLYEALDGISISEISVIMFNLVSSAELVSGIVLWTGANLGIPKDIFISLLNVVMVIGLFLLARKYRVPSPMIGLLLTNFYLFVLMTSAERLKISYILLIMGGLLSGKMKFLALMLAPFAHLQCVIFLSGISFASFGQFIKNRRSSLSISKLSIMLSAAGLTIVAFVIYSLFDSTLAKASHYASKEVSQFELVNLGILTVIALYVTRERLRMVLVQVPMFVSAALIGATRVNMIAISLVVYYLMIEKKLNHPLIYLLMIYFSIKSIGFIMNIYTYGHGFP